MKQEKLFDLFTINNIHFASIRTFQHLKTGNHFEASFQDRITQFKIVNSGQVKNFNNLTLKPNQILLFSDTQPNKFMVIEIC
ncbi:hypothetical protein [Companilactobacillus sp. HBUAS59699]|uniref:hypothetical protein n=1 Tax=Companilactobacillus sp. HBUAS59699 TaxID=3109358 RepID=UPI002FF0AA38